jgi:predicted nucleotide-binding protein
MAIPVFTTADDVRKILSYLKTKPVGATKAQASAVVGAKLVDDRKAAAYQALAIVEQDGDKWKLTELGRHMSKANDREFAELLRNQVMEIGPYRGCLEWAYHNNVSELIAEDVIAHWHTHYRDDVGTEVEKSLRERAVCFLQLCSGAGLGPFIVGRKGQSSRLQILRDALEAAITGAEPVPQDRPEDETASGTANLPGRDEGKPAPEEQLGSKGKGIFIAHGKNKKSLQELKKILDGFKVLYKVVEEEPNLGRPISDKVRQTMEACDAAIMIFTADEELKDLNGNAVWRPSENVPHELGAAGLKYGKRIVILKDSRVTLASNYSDLGYIAFEEYQLAAKSVDVIKELIGFGILKVTT